MFTTRAYQKVEWSVKNTNIVASGSEFNIAATAFVGAITLDKGVVHYELFKRSVDGEKFMEFLHGFKRAHGRPPCYLYMDNLKVHKTNDVKALMEKYKITPVYSPIYSPDYNPIEYCFSKLKCIVKKMRLHDML